MDLKQVNNIPSRVDQRPLTPEDRRQNFIPQSWRFNLEGQDFDFRQGRIFINGQELAKHIAENLSHLGAHYWTNLSRRLARYRDWALLNVEDAEALGKFFGLINAILAKVYGRIKKKYNETISGVNYHLEDGELVINGINVGACLNMARKKRTKKGRVFLKGLRGRLTVLLETRGNNQIENIRETLENFAGKIDHELITYPPEVIALPAGEVG